MIRNTTLSTLALAALLTGLAVAQNPAPAKQVAPKAAVTAAAKDTTKKVTKPATAAKDTTKKAVAPKKKTHKKTKPDSTTKKPA
jgi:outer membrane biosynthesis protein TonB